MRQMYIVAKSRYDAILNLPKIYNLELSSIYSLRFKHARKLLFHLGAFILTKLNFLYVDAD